MLGTVTAVSGPLFAATAAIVVVVVASVLVRVWTGFADRVKRYESDNDRHQPSLVWPVVASIVLVVAVLVGLAAGWTHLQGMTTNLSNYQNPAEQIERQQVVETPTPTKEELQARREAQRQQAEVVPQVKATESFNEAMRQEAEKIRRRSLGASQPAERN